MNKQQAIEIIEREPVGGAQFYDTKNDRFYSRYCNEWYRFDGDEWVMHRYVLYSARLKFKPMHEILGIALGED
jgi:hypothetical protein